MLKRTVLLAVLVAAVSAGWASGLFWFGLSQVVTGFTKLVENCPDSTAACVTGSLQLIFGAIAAGVGGYNIQFQGWRRDEGVYHLYEAGHPLVKGLIRLGAKTESFVDILKPHHVGKENEATIIHHHKDGSMRRGLYHYNNETKGHYLHASFGTMAEGEDLLRRETVGPNDGFGAIFNDLDAGTWSNVNHGNDDIGTWTSQTIQQMESNDADSFCMGFQDPDNGNENVGALRVQPANEGDYNGVNFGACGSDNFRRGFDDISASLGARSERAVRELRRSISRRLAWGKGDYVSRGPGSTLKQRSEECGAFDCSSGADCEVFGCEYIRCDAVQRKCIPETYICRGDPSNC